MGSPTIFNGSFTKLLTSRAIVQSNGQINEQNGPINYINNYGGEIDTSTWTTYSDNQTVTMTTATPTVATVAATAGFYSGMPITFTNSGGALPTGVSAATTYWVSTVVSGTTFRFSASLGGGDVAVSGAGSGVNTYRPLVPVTATSSALTGLTFSRNTTTPLRGAGDLKLAQTNSTVVAGQGIYYPFTIDSADKGKVLTIKFDFNADANFSAANGTTTPNAGGAGDSDIEVYILDVTGAVLIPVTPQVISANGTNNFTFSGVFQTGSTNTSYRLCLHASKYSASATGYNFRADNVFVGPQTAPLGVPMTDWKSFTPSGSFTNVTYTGFYRRYGDSGQIRIRMAFTGAPATQATLTLNYLPPGWTLDTTKMTSTATDGSVVMGSGTMVDAATGVWYVVAYYTSATQITLQAQNLNSHPNHNTLPITNLLPLTFASGDGIEVVLPVIPITGFSSNCLMSNDTDTRVCAASYYMSANQSVTANSASVYANFDTKEYDTHAAVTTTSAGTAGTWRFTAPISGIYSVKMIMAQQTTISTTNYMLFKNGVAYKLVGALCNTTNSVASGVTEISLNAGDYIFLNAQNSVGLQGGALSANVCQIQISRLSGPAVVAATESIAMRYTTVTGTTIPVSFAVIPFNVLAKDTHNAYNTSTGLYTVPVSGLYSVKAMIATAALTLSTSQGLQLAVFKNVSQYSVLGQLLGNGASVSMVVSGTDEVPCVAGDTLAIYAQAGSAGSLSINTGFNHLSIVRVGN